MSLKKELLSKLTEKQLKELAESKGISFKMTEKQRKYYENWSDRERMIDIMNDTNDLTIKEIEEFIKSSINR
ncbi:MAG: hypothetical protein DRN12_05880 [Thermoplasmata archaeon]|nr:MAG: hypothetical protein DRN12_05880 [Thermoplasmata archaeon]